MSLWVNGVDPGFANDWLPLVMTSVCERIDEVRCMEILDYATYDQPSVLFDIMGFGQPLDEVPFILLPRDPHHCVGQRRHASWRPAST